MLIAIILGLVMPSLPTVVMMVHPCPIFAAADGEGFDPASDFILDEENRRGLPVVGQVSLRPAGSIDAVAGPAKDRLVLV